MKVRKIFFDTETTGRPSYASGHRIVEIAAIELLEDGSFGKKFQTYVNPGRDIPDDVIKVHGITNETVAKAPKFKDVIDDFLDFIKGAELLAHNSDFDEGFISAEMQAMRHPKSFWQDIVGVTDTLQLSRQINPEARGHSLDNILDRYEISREDRTLHSALLDCELLAKAYLKMTDGVDLSVPSLEEDVPRPEIKRLKSLPDNLPSVSLSKSQLKNHEQYLNDMKSSASSFVEWPSIKMTQKPTL